MATMRRVVGTLVAITALTVGLAIPVAASTAVDFVSLINAERAAAGLGALTMHADLVDDAVAHSEEMREQDRLYHNPDLAGVATGWMALGENVGVGPTVTILHQAFMDSPPHRANVLGDYDAIGVGVSVVSADQMWVTMVFMKSAAVPAPAAAPAPKDGGAAVVAASSSIPTPPAPNTTVIPTSDPAGDRPDRFAVASGSARPVVVSNVGIHTPLAM